jgi:anthranilate phosphoribosyltransferase
MKNVNPYEGMKIMINGAIGKVVFKGDLTCGEMEEMMKEEITIRTTSLAEIATFITALRMKGETPEEIMAAATHFNEGFELASQSIDSGKAFNTLERLVEFTNAE